MSVDPAVQQEIREKQLAGCPSENKLTIVITGHQDDPKEKATVYNFRCTLLKDGSEKTTEKTYRYSALLKVNEALIERYGAIRILRLFPPKKFVGNKEGDFVIMRRDAIQNWATELVLDEELCEEPVLLEAFDLIPKSA